MQNFLDGNLQSFKLQKFFCQIHQKTVNSNVNKKAIFKLKIYKFIMHEKINFEASIYDTGEKQF